MSNLHRLAWIDACIREGRHPNGRTIAEHFEISVRQAQRDIEYLRYSMGAPVEYSALKNGYYYTDRAFALPSVFMTGSDRSLLSWLASQYSLAGGERAMQLADLFGRLSGDQPWDNGASQTLPVFDIDHPETSVFNILFQASSRNLKVRMNYCNRDGESQDRVIHPYKLFKKNGTGYVAGYCELRRQIRVFRLSRILDITALEEPFAVSALFREEDFGPSIGFKFREPYHALVEFDIPPDIRAFKLEMAPEAGGLWRISFESSQEIIAALLSCGPGFKIHHPQWLKERLRERLGRIVESNFGNDIICRTGPV